MSLQAPQISKLGLITTGKMTISVSWEAYILAMKYHLNEVGVYDYSDTVAEYEAELLKDPKYDLVQCVVSTGKASEPPDDWIAVQTPEDSDETYTGRIYRAAVTVSDKVGLRTITKSYTGTQIYTSI